MDLREISDRLEILDMYSRYVHATDTRNIDDLDERVFLPDATIDWTSAGHIKVVWKEDGRADYQRNAFANKVDFHLYGNTRIDFVDETTAKCITKVINMSIKDGPDAFAVFGEYDDVVVKTDAGWRIKERVWLFDTVVQDLKVTQESGLKDEE